MGSNTREVCALSAGYLTERRIKIVRSGKFYPTKRSRSLTGQCSFKRVDRPSLISKIHHLLEIHSAQRVRNEIYKSACSHRLHKAFYKAIRLCFEQKIYESKLFPVADLFLELYLCEGSLQAIFSIIAGHETHTSSFMHNNVNILYPGHVDDCIDAFEYYLHHMSSLKIEEFCENTGKPLDVINQTLHLGSNDTPLILAVTKKNPRLVLALLRYGADPFLGIVDTDEDRTPDPTDHLLNELNGISLFKNTAFSPETRKALIVEEGKVLSCLQMIRRAVTHIPLSVSSHVNTCPPNNSEDSQGTVNTKEYPLQPALANSMDLASYTSPNLQQLCRSAIRVHLHKVQGTHRSLPRSIALLPLPNLLKRYVDLLID